MRLLYVFSLLLSLAAYCTGCKDQPSIVHKWVIQDIAYPQDSSGITNFVLLLLIDDFKYIEFCKNQTLKISRGDDLLTGKYRLINDGSQIEVEYDDSGKIDTAIIVKLDVNTLWITSTKRDSTILKLKKE